MKAASVNEPQKYELMRTATLIIIQKFPP